MSYTQVLIFAVVAVFLIQAAISAPVYYYDGNDMPNPMDADDDSASPTQAYYMDSSGSNSDASYDPADMYKLASYHSSLEYTYADDYSHSSASNGDDSYDPADLYKLASYHSSLAYSYDDDYSDPESLASDSDDSYDPSNMYKLASYHSSLAYPYDDSFSTEESFSYQVVASGSSPNNVHAYLNGEPVSVSKLPDGFQQNLNDIIPFDDLGEFPQNFNDFNPFKFANQFFSGDDTSENDAFGNEIFADYPMEVPFSYFM